jgi:hypothetical protein
LKTEKSKNSAERNGGNHKHHHTKIFALIRLHLGCQVIAEYVRVIQEEIALHYKEEDRTGSANLRPVLKNILRDPKAADVDAYDKK